MSTPKKNSSTSVDIEPLFMSPFTSTKSGTGRLKGLIFFSPINYCNSPFVFIEHDMFI